MIDPFDALAMSVYHLPGVYALLVGSGVSRPADIPTGAMLTENLIREVARASGDDCGAKPRDWYKTKYNGENPSYSNVLENVAKTPDERSAILRSYFELNEEEKNGPNEALKRPTRAHKRIATLVERGFFKVILTTNFDTLMEQALDGIHASYQVISSTSDIPNALPLVHAKCTIVKLHGDYKNANIRNTVDELSSYDPPMQRLLDQVLSEYGLIVCGWSAESDIALATTLQGCTSTRYSTYWTVRKEPRSSVEPIIKKRKAHMIDIADADSFFTQLEEKVEALKNLDLTGAPTAEMASATVKRYLRSSEHRIEVHDFVMKQVDETLPLLSHGNLVLNTTNVSQDLQALQMLMQHYEEATKIVRAIMITGCRWGLREHHDTWLECLRRVAVANFFLDGSLEAYLKLYPALLILYSGGIATIAAGKNDVQLGKYDLLRTLLTKLTLKPRITEPNRPLIAVVQANLILRGAIGQRLAQVFTIAEAGNEYLYRVLRPSFTEILPFEDEYRECFDRFEYMLNLVHASLTQGRFPALGGLYRTYKNLAEGDGIVAKLDLEMAQMAETWPPFRAGLFEGTIQGFGRAKSMLAQSPDKV